MIILDTNVLSALMRQAPEAKVVAWLDKQPRTSIWITSVTVLEICFGLQIMPTGKRSAALVEAFDEFLERLDCRIAAFDTDAAEQAAGLMANRSKRGRPGELRDTMIAGIVLSHHATLATRNTSHFDDLGSAVVNPWAA
jgi:toxin FitB